VEYVSICFGSVTALIFGIPHGGKDLPSPSGKPLGGGAPEARRAAGDEDRPASSIAPPHPQAAGSGIIGAGFLPLPATRGFLRLGLVFRFRRGGSRRFMPPMSGGALDASNTSLLSKRCS